MSQQPLITRRDLLNHGAASDFLGQFDVRPIEVQVVTAGALGAMSVAWRQKGQTTWSADVPSEAGSSWTWELPDPAWASVTFPAGSYTAGDTWTIATAGTVVVQGTPSAGPPTATRNDVVAAKIAEVSSKIAEWTQPRCVPPILSLGEGQKGGAAAIVIYRLKSRQGMTPAQAGSGDENLRAVALDAQRDFERIGASAQRPPDIVDSSASNLGAGLSAMPLSDSPRGW